MEASINVIGWSGEGYFLSCDDTFFAFILY